MAKKILGIDIGCNRLKLVLTEGKKILKAVKVDMPENLIHNGRIASVETLSELIRSTMKTESMRCSLGAWLISDENAFLRNVTMPQMKTEQLVYNIPYEFRDYITGELKDYLFDYAMISTPEQMAQSKNSEDKEYEDFNGAGMDLMAVSVPVEIMQEVKQVFRKAGLKMVKAAPAVCAYSALLPDDTDNEYCIVDLGYNSIRVHVFKGPYHKVTRVLETGMFRLNAAIAEAFNVDVHLAHTYLLTNYEDCQNKDVCLNVFHAIAVEIMRVLNFYRFSNPDSNINTILLDGGGANIAPLQQALSDVLGTEVDSAAKLVENGENISECTSFVQAIGVTRIADSVSSRKLPTKRTINMAILGEKKTSKPLAAVAMVAIIVFASLFSKFAVADRLIKLSRLQSEVRTLQNEIAEGYKTIEEYGDLVDKYAHYTYSGMTSEEINRVDRLKIAKLLQDVVLPYAKISDWKVTGNRLDLPITGATLQDINLIVQQLEAQDMVDFCTVITAATDDKNANSKVTAQVTVYLKNALETEQ